MTGFRSFLALITALVLIGTGPVMARDETAPPASQSESVHKQLERLAEELKAQSDRLIGAAAQAAQRAMVENEDVLAAQLETFRGLLNDQKANLDIIGQDAATTLDALSQAAKESWEDMHRSALEALDQLQAWLEQQSGSDEQIPV